MSSVANPRAENAAVRLAQAARHARSAFQQGAEATRRMSIVPCWQGRLPLPPPRPLCWPRTAKPSICAAASAAAPRRHRGHRRKSTRRRLRAR
eukprot:115581-Chlamydomonas_euryale.AAC.1